MSSRAASPRRRSGRGSRSGYPRYGRDVRSTTRMLAAAGCALAVAYAVDTSTGATRASVAKRSGPPPISRAEPDSEVRLVPNLNGGTAGWSVEFRTAHTGGGGPPESPRGPIYAEGCSTSSTVTELDLLTSSSVAAVSVLGGPPIRTRTYPTLIDGLRAVVVEVKRGKGQAMCPKVTPLNARLRPLSLHGKRNSPLAISPPDTAPWLGKLDSGRRTCPISPPSPASCVLPPHPPAGACHLTASNPGPGITEQGGAIATRIKPVIGLAGPAFLSCADYDYFYEEEDQLDSAVLLNATHPGAEPPRLPGMRALTGHPGIFTTLGGEGIRVARRIPGAWLVVEESDQIGLAVPLLLLDSLSAEINLNYAATT